MRDYFKKGNFTFVFPIDGDCINSHDGTVVNGGIKIEARVKADAETLSICGVKAEKRGDEFVAEIVIKDGKNTLTAESADEKQSITVYRFKKAEKGYRVSSDDNILFLKDINDNKDKYASIFENPYLAGYKRAHDECGAKVQLNLFYETADLAGFSSPIEYFNLSMMTDKFKDEFRANSDWLKLTFHARKENPSHPYRNDPVEVIAEDLAAVNREIVRFAGEECLSVGTTIHFGAASEESVKKAKELGYDALAGYFELYVDGSPLVSYFYPIDLILHVGERDFWVDNELGIFYARIDRVMNYDKEPEKNIAALEEVMTHPGRNEFFEVMIHEQYFYRDYALYIPAFFDIVVGTCKWLKAHGYDPRFMEEVYSD